MSVDPVTVQSAVTAIIQEMIGELELEFDDPIGPQTRLIADLGFASVDFVHLIVELEGHFQRKMGFHDLIMPTGQYVDDLAVGDLVAFISRRLAGDEPTPPPAEVAAISEPGVKNVSDLRPEDVEHFRGLMPSLEKWGAFSSTARKNPRMAFVLSSPRSGSTLLRVILAGNQQLFAPPELHLLYYSTMAQRRRALSNKWNEHLLTGTVRALMNLKSWTSEQATEFLRSCEEAEMPTHEFFRVLQDMLGNRLLVDKTPTYAMSGDILARAERDFDNPLFIHLVRHPGGMVRSFEDGKMGQLTPFMRNSKFTSRQLGELTWLVTNRNIADFLRPLPAGRKLLVRYEDLVRAPEDVVRRVCDFLGVTFVSEMLDPYRDQDIRMTDGLNTVAQSSGDLKFHLHARIEPEAADRWKKFDSENTFSPMSCELAAEFGY